MTKKEKDAIIAAGRKENGGKPLDGESNSSKAKKSKKVIVEDEEDLEPEEEEIEEQSEDESDEEDEESEDEGDAGDEDEADEEIDYAEIAAAETKRAEEAEEARKKAEDALAQNSFKKRKNKRDNKDDDDEDEDDDEDKPITKRELKNILSGVQQSTQKTLQESQALEIARRHTTSEAEARAAVLFYKTRVQPTGNLEEDVLFAIGGMNRKKQIAKNGEIARALKSKDGANRNGTSGHRLGDADGKSKISKSDNSAILNAGMTWDATKKVYKKPLGNGKKFFYYDPKSKKRWVK